MLSICLEEGLNNARKYCEPESMIRVTSTCEKAPARAFEAADSTSSASPRVLHIEVDNLNRSGVTALTEEECSQVFKPGYKAHTSSASSSGVGLDSTMKAIMAAGGKAMMSVVHDSPAGTHTVLHLVLPVECVHDSSEECTVAALEREAPSAVCTAEAHTTTRPDMPLDISNTAVLVGATVPAVPAPRPDDESNIVAALSDNVESLTGTELQAAQEAGPPPARPLACAALDDSFLSRMLHEEMFESFLNADPQRSCVLGKTREEQVSFVDVVLGHKSVNLQEMAPPLSPVDIVVLDQNIEFDGQVHLLGSEIAGQLHTASFQGVVCIMTGSSAHAIEQIAKLPGVDLVLEKGTNVAKVALQLQAVHRVKASSLHCS